MNFIIASLRSTNQNVQNNSIDLLSNYCIELFDTEDLLRRLKQLLKLLPLHHRRLTRYMFDFLGKVAQHVDNNKMNPKNLATIWGAIFLKASESEALDALSLKQASEIMDLTLIMINNYDLLLTDD
jgi:hypothetical protein